MDKYELVFDIIEHPEKYTADRLNELLSDTETREIYNLICKTDSSVESQKKIDVDTEWDDFKEKNSLHSRHSFMWFGNRAASIVTIICTSILAVAAGIVVTVALTNHKTELTANTEVTVKTSSVTVSSDNMTVQTDTANVDLTPIMFENEPLETVMEKIADIYGIKVKFNNNEVACLHLYYKLDPTQSLDEIVEQLNTFEQINIIRNGNILNID